MALRRSIGAGVMVCGVVAASVAVAADREALRGDMRALYQELSVLLPAAVAGKFQDPQLQANYLPSLRALAERARQVDRHADALGPGARLFGQALARDAAAAGSYFEQKNFELSAYYVQSLVDDCIACHTRLPAVDSPWAEGFVAQDELEALTPLERAALQVATRRFDDALRLYESVFRAPENQRDLPLDALGIYLTVSLRTERDPGRAHALISEIAKREDLPRIPKEDLETWRDRLAETTTSDLQGTTLERAREAVKRADSLASYPGDPHALADYLIASAQLYQLRELPQRAPRDVAEIYFLLGRSELGISRGRWLPRADLFLETAIRLDPGGPMAQVAFTLLETETLASYTGSGGLRLPPEEKARLDDLRGLLEVSERRREPDGASLFAYHCAFCHGSDGTGNGPAAPTLMTTPLDLTRIAERRGGAFPHAEIRSLVDGRDPLEHRSPEMPRWGEFWADPGKLDAVVEYLRILQR